MKVRKSPATPAVLGILCLLVWAGFQFLLLPNMGALAARYRTLPRPDHAALKTASAGTEVLVSGRLDETNPVLEKDLIMFLEEHHEERSGSQSSRWVVKRAERPSLLMQMEGGGMAVLKGEFDLFAGRIVEVRTGVRYHGMARGDRVGVHGTARDPDARGRPVVEAQFVLRGGDAQSLIDEQVEGMRITSIVSWSFFGLGVLFLAWAVRRAAQ